MATTRDVVVGRVGKAHGIRGEVAVEVRTDEPDRRFAEGVELTVEVPRPGTAPEHDGSTLTVRAIRWHGSRLLVRFAELRDRTAAEAARGWVLHAAVAADETPEDPDEFYDHQLVGLAVETTTGQPVGELAAVLHGPGQDLLSVRAPDGREILVPFVAALVQTVDVPGGRVVVEDRPGLLDPAVGDEEGGA